MNKETLDLIIEPLKDYLKKENPKNVDLIEYTFDRIEIIKSLYKTHNLDKSEKEKEKLYVKLLNEEVKTILRLIISEDIISNKNMDTIFDLDKPIKEKIEDILGLTELKEENKEELKLIKNLLNEEQGVEDTMYSIIEYSITKIPEESKEEQEIIRTILNLTKNRKPILEYFEVLKQISDIKITTDKKTGELNMSPVQFDTYLKLQEQELKLRTKLDEINIPKIKGITSNEVKITPNFFMDLTISTKEANIEKGGMVNNIKNFFNSQLPGLGNLINNSSTALLLYQNNDPYKYIKELQEKADFVLLNQETTIIENIRLTRIGLKEQSKEEQEEFIKILLTNPNYMNKKQENHLMENAQDEEGLEKVKELNSEKTNAITTFILKMLVETGKETIDIEKQIENLTEMEIPGTNVKIKEIKSFVEKCVSEDLENILGIDKTKEGLEKVFNKIKEKIKEYIIKRVKEIYNKEEGKIVQITQEKINTTIELINDKFNIKEDSWEGVVSKLGNNNIVSIASIVNGVGDNISVATSKNDKYIPNLNNLYKSEVYINNILDQIQSNVTNEDKIEVLLDSLTGRRMKDTSIENQYSKNMEQDLEVKQKMLEKIENIFSNETRIQKNETETKDEYEKKLKSMLLNGEKQTKIKQVTTEKQRKNVLKIISILKYKLKIEEMFLINNNFVKNKHFNTTPSKDELLKQYIEMEETKEKLGVTKLEKNKRNEDKIIDVYLQKVEERLLDFKINSQEDNIMSKMILANKNQNKINRSINIKSFSKYEYKEETEYEYRQRMIKEESEKLTPSMKIIGEIKTSEQWEEWKKTNNRSININNPVEIMVLIKNSDLFKFISEEELIILNNHTLIKEDKKLKFEWYWKKKQEKQKVPNIVSEISERINNPYTTKISNQTQPTPTPEHKQLKK